MNNPVQMLNQLKQNPMQFLTQKGLNVPQNISNDPNAIIQHLMNTGQVSQDQYNNAINVVKQMGFKQ